MDVIRFFTYYIKALSLALENDNINHGYLVKSPSWYYPTENESLYHELMKFEDHHYEEFPILEKVGLYFDAKSHYFDNIDGTDINLYRNQIVNEINQLSKRLHITVKI